MIPQDCYARPDTCVMKYRSDTELLPGVTGYPAANRLELERTRMCGCGILICAGLPFLLGVLPVLSDYGLLVSPSENEHVRHWSAASAKCHRVPSMAELREKHTSLGTSAAIQSNFACRAALATRGLAGAQRIELSKHLDNPPNSILVGVFAFGSSLLLLNLTAKSHELCTYWYLRGCTGTFSYGKKGLPRMYTCRFKYRPPQSAISTPKVPCNQFSQSQANFCLAASSCNHASPENAPIPLQLPPDIWRHPSLCSVFQNG